MRPPSERIRDAVREALDGAAMGARRFERARGLRPWTLRGLLDPKRKQAPSVDRAAEICGALGLELRIAPRAGEPPPPDPGGGGDAPPGAETADAPALAAAVERAVRAEIETLRAAADARAPAATRQVEVVEVAAAAGGGAEADDERAVSALSFRRDWLDANGLDPTQCMVMRVRGASMEPTLPDGSRVLVNRAARRRRAGKLYVLRTGDGLVIKRAGQGADGGWRLVSDNPAPEYPAVPWPDDAETVGEVRWMAQTFS